MRFSAQITDNDVLDAIRDLGYVATLPALFALFAHRYNVDRNNPMQASNVRNQIDRRLGKLVKFRFLRRTGQKGEYRYHLVED